MPLVVLSVNLWKTKKCLNLKHLVMYRNSHNISVDFFAEPSTNMVLDTLLSPLFI